MQPNFIGQPDFKGTNKEEGRRASLCERNVCVRVSAWIPVALYKGIRKMEVAVIETGFYSDPSPEVNPCMILHAQKRQRAGEDW